MVDPRSLFSGKRITVMGLGLLGRGLKDTLFLVDCGAQLTVTDLKTEDELAPSLERLRGRPVVLHLGRHEEADFINADMILRNADVPRSSPFLKLAAENGVPVEMDESLFCKHFTGRVIGVTGTRGKTTTTTLIHRIISSTARGVHLAGNIMGRATLPLLGIASHDDTVVLELSSWQLQGFHDARISPHASVFTNVYPDHLNRYAGMEEYIEDKKAIFRYQRDGDFCIFNGDQPESPALAREAPAESRFFRVSDVPEDWNIPLPGIHNRANVAAALCMADRLGIARDIVRREVESFPGVEHRLQRLGEKDGVEFIDDSTSTTPVAGCAALDSIVGKRILLIAGGADKKLDLTPFGAAAAVKAAKIALLEGTATAALENAIRGAGGGDGIVGLFGNLEQALESLMKEAVPGDVVLLSPGCASFGMFRNEFHRGETFMALVREILG